jgi:hypothetical protein
VPRFVHRRAIVLFLLLCQVLAAGIVLVPMAKAAQSSPVATTLGHCHDNASAAHQTSGTSLPTSDPTHHCKSGFCACVCLNTPAALPEISLAVAPRISHPPLLVSDPLAAAPERVSVFFRPPI